MAWGAGVWEWKDYKGYMKTEVQKYPYFKHQLTIYKLYDLNHGLISLSLSFSGSKNVVTYINYLKLDLNKNYTQE